MNMNTPPPPALHTIDPRWQEILAPFREGDYPDALAAVRDYVNTVTPEVRNRFLNFHYSNIYNNYAVSAYHVLTDENPLQLNQAGWDEFLQALEQFICANEQEKKQQPAAAWWKKDLRPATSLLDHVLDLLLRYRPGQWVMEAESWIRRFMAIWGERLALDVLLKAMHNERINVLRPDYVANTRNLAQIYLRLTETLPPDLYRHPRSLVMDILSDLAYFTGSTQAEDEALEWVEQALAINPDDRFARQRRKDIQERKGVMEQIRRFNHDANTAIAGLISTLTHLEHLSLSDPAPTLVEKIRLGLKRIHGVHRLVQKQEAGFVNVVVRQEVERLLPDYEEQIRFVVSGGEDGATLETDQDYLQIVLENLLRNAREAFDRRQIPVSERLIHITLDLPGRRILLRDNAGGIDPNLKDRIFEPYVSSKAVKQNTGLGLASVREAMTLLEGRIELTDPQPANGAEFALYFS
jgi:signal transduction histidine kinase